MTWAVFDGRVSHYIADGTTPASYSSSGPDGEPTLMHTANSRCLCGRVRPGDEVTPRRRGIMATRCREIADRRGIPRPLPPLNWRKEARALAQEVMERDARAERHAVALMAEE
jgi:hypothetical protein